MMALPFVEPVSYEAVLQARQRIAGSTLNTPCPASAALSELTGCDVYCKLEYLQRTGSFKERGAANALAQLDGNASTCGVIAASAGNHALALSYHGQRLGIPVTVVMPTAAPLIKVASCRHYGANVIAHGESFDQAKHHADALALSKGLTYIHGYDDADIIAGQGTLGLEIVEQVPRLDAIVLPIGGAGLIAGVALAIKHIKPSTEVIGVEPARMPSYSAAMAAGGAVSIASQPTLADGLAVGRIGERAWATSRGKVDLVVQVDEAGLALAVLRLMELEKAVVEGAAAAPLAALLGPSLEHLRGKTVVLPMCGGNIDPATLHRVIEHGLAADGRLHNLDILISDRPGGLADLTRVLADAGASIRDLRHDRAFAGPDVATASVQVMIETQDQPHRDRVCQQLEAHGYRLNKNRTGLGHGH